MYTVTEHLMKFHFKEKMDGKRTSISSSIASLKLEYGVIEKEWIR